MAEDKLVPKDTTASAKTPKVWKKMLLCVPSQKEMAGWDVLDVLKYQSAMKSARPAAVLKPGISNEAYKARAVLAEDPNNLFYIHELGAIYASEGQLEKCLNIIIRGWKRASEIEDVHVRFRFLMKIAELSFMFKKYRQAHAVLADTEEPEDAEELFAYLVLSCKTNAQKGDLEAALKLFQRLIDGLDIGAAVRAYALTVEDIKLAGGLEAAKLSIEKISKEAPSGNSELETLEMYAEKIGQEPSKTQADQAKTFLIATAVAVVSIVVALLYMLEKRSFAAIAPK